VNFQLNLIDSHWFKFRVHYVWVWAPKTASNISHKKYIFLKKWRKNVFPVLYLRGKAVDMPHRRKYRTLRRRRRRPKNPETMRTCSLSLTHNSPKYLEWNWAWDFRRIFPIKLRNFKLRKMPKLLNVRFPEGWYFLKSNKTAIKRSSKRFFFLLLNGIVRRYWVNQIPIFAWFSLHAHAQGKKISEIVGT